MLRYQCGPFFEEWHCEPPQDPAQGYQVLQDRWVQEPSGANVRQILRIELAESEPVPGGMLGAAASIEARSRRESP